MKSKLKKIINMDKDEFRRQQEVSKEKIRAADKLMGIAYEIQCQLDEAKTIIKEHDPITFERARAYCIPHIEMALTNDHDWAGKCMVSLQDIADEIRGFSYDEEE